MQKPGRPTATNFYEAVYEITAAIPSGQVATYGSIATWLGAPRAARAVGYALAADLGGSVPWHRVINAQGRISEGGSPERAPLQRRRLNKEHVAFSKDDILDLKAYAFRPTAQQLRRWLALGDKIRALQKT